MGPSRARETVQVKSAAEFFTENQNIAGFDNPGKSLFTTLRELIENSLDASESIGVSPEIDVTVEELSQDCVDAERGVVAGDRVDLALFEDKNGKKKKPAGKKKRKKKKKGDDDDDDDDDEEEEEEEEEEEDGDDEKGDAAGSGANRRHARSEKSKASYYKVTCRDNGCGIKAEVLPDALGRVLAGSKYGVRQTRGKFGLGAKMALIWAKKSTGAPVIARSSTSPSGRITRIVLDIDIRKNEPKVLGSAEIKFEFRSSAT